MSNHLVDFNQGKDENLEEYGSRVFDQLRKWGKQYRVTLDQIKEISSLIHKKECKFEHTEECGWYYHAGDGKAPWDPYMSEWDDRVPYLKKAMEIISQIGYRAARSKYK